MKKVLYVFLISFLSFGLISCSKKEEKLVISKLYTAKRMANNLIELYNNSDKDIKLDKYKIDFYNDGSKEVTNTIDLIGEIKANSYYVISGNAFDSTTYEGVSDKVDLVHDKTLPYNGDDALALVKGKKIIDFIGYTEGVAIKYNTNIAYFRLGNKEDYVATTEFSQFNFVHYLPDSYQYLKNDNYEIKTLEQIYKGPGLHDFYKERPYAEGELGTGGAVTASVVSIADGDTATFSFDEKPAGTSSHRYYYIDTAETAGPNTNDEPWGAIGSMYNKEFLLKNSSEKEIRVQSIPFSGLHDTYSRNLGLIWVNGKLSQFLIVQEGLSKVDALYDDIDLELYWKDIPYKTFLLFAQERAKNNGWGIHGFPANQKGEKAPDWDYGSSKRAPQSSYQDWKPHVSLVW